MKMSRLERRIAAASGREAADLVIRNGKIIDVFNGEVIKGDIAIVDGYIIGIGDYKGNKAIDADGKYVAPAFIDGHVHIESSLVPPEEFAKVLLLHGVTTVVADPHEIANVSGTAGIQYMLNTSENLPFDFYFMLPSCVPATSFERSGATLNAVDLEPFYRHPRVLGLAEVMNYPAVLNAETEMIQKLYDAANHGKRIDGHAAGLHERDLNVYLAAGIRTDHESTTAEEAKERLQRGMYLMIREGTVAKDLLQLLPAVNERNARRCLFVTDDKHLDDLVHEGSIDHNVRLAIANGIPPMTAIQMATLNAAECFGLEEQGAIAPGRKADIIFFDCLENIQVTHVIKNGAMVVENGKLKDDFPKKMLEENSRLHQTVHFNEINEDHFKISIKSAQTNIIEIIPNSLVTRQMIQEIQPDRDGFFQASTKEDLLKLAVIERHHHTGLIGLGIVKGLELQSGAIATTIAHDSHNLIVAGTNDENMAAAANCIKAMQGGLAVVHNGKIIASLELPIAGLLSDRPYQEVLGKLNLIHDALGKIGAPRHFNPFLTLSFLALPVIPELKLTCQGLFQVSRFEHISLEKNSP